MSEGALLRLMRAIAGRESIARGLLDAAPALAREQVKAGATRGNATRFFLESIKHYVYAGDTALHIAAAAYDVAMAKKLVGLGADIDARNRRGAAALHYAVDGGPGAEHWDPKAQAAMVGLLIAAGADSNAVDKGGVTPLHRAVRNRCAAAVAALLTGGADAKRKNKSGSTALQLARITTGRGGSGSPEAKAQQADILALLEP